jgi:glycosyltransferase involved in cell wall biosynthesis
MGLELSVIICTHNPRAEYLARTLGALRGQTLPVSRWELLLVDNASAAELAKCVDLPWHPGGRHVREEQLGLTPARLRGIAEAGADLLVFVDDDNVLNADYLEQARQVSRDYPFLGAWGGQAVAEFEQPPPAWTRPYWPYLAIREVTADRWSNFPWLSDATPWGAGLCVRRAVAQRYAEHCRCDESRQGFDRQGALLTSCGDIDLALTACELGLGTGVFQCLGLTHLIPANRLDRDYLLRLVESSCYSSGLLCAIRGSGLTPDRRPRLIRLGRRVLDLVRMNRVDRLFQRAKERGWARALREQGAVCREGRAAVQSP